MLSNQVIRIAAGKERQEEQGICPGHYLDFIARKKQHRPAVRSFDAAQAIFCMSAGEETASDQYQINLLMLTALCQFIHQKWIVIGVEQHREQAAFFLSRIP